MSVLTLSPSTPVLGKRRIVELQASPILSRCSASSPVFLRLDGVDSDKCSEVKGTQCNDSGSDSETDEELDGDSAEDQSKRETQVKAHHCTYPDCGKSYNRPAKLAEHERSHTGVVSNLSMHPVISGS